MQRSSVHRLVAICLTVLAAVSPAVLTVSGGTAEAATPCTPVTSAPVVLSTSVTDVTVGLARGYDAQVLTVHADNPCGSAGCSIGEKSGCTAVEGSFTAQRTAGSGAGCRHDRFLDFNSSTAEADGSTTYVDTFAWTDNDDNDDLDSPRLSNACAGAYDTVVTLDNSRYDPTNPTANSAGYVSSASQPFAQSRSFTVRRPARLTADAGPEPVRRGRTVTVGGRLTRANWDARYNPFVAYPGQSVLLQRRTLAGTYHTLRSVRTDRRGYLHTSLKALSGTRCYRFVSTENATTQGVASGGDCVRAR